MKHSSHRHTWFALNYEDVISWQVINKPFDNVKTSLTICQYFFHVHVQISIKHDHAIVLYAELQ